MAEPYRKGEYVRYACNGVCLVDDIRLDVPAGKGTPKEFYILKPVSNPASTIFVPTGSPALVEKMARLPNREELDQLILSVKDHPLPWIEDRKARLASFQTIVKACDLRELICLVVCISRRKRSLLASERRLPIPVRSTPTLPTICRSQSTIILLFFVCLINEFIHSSK